MTPDLSSPRLWEQQTDVWRPKLMFCFVCVCVCVAATAGQTGFLRAVVMAAAGPPGPDLPGPAEVSTR